MKKFTFRSLLAIAAAGVLFTACKDENDDGNTSKTTYEFSVKAEDNPISPRPTARPTPSWSPQPKRLRPERAQ